MYWQNVCLYCSCNDWPCHSSQKSFNDPEWSFCGFNSGLHSFWLIAKHLSNDTTFWGFVCSYVIIKNLHSMVSNFNLNNLEFKSQNSIFWAIARRSVRQMTLYKTIQKSFPAGIRKASTNVIFRRTDPNLMKLFMKRSQFFLFNLQEKDRSNVFEIYSIISWWIKTAQPF